MEKLSIIGFSTNHHFKLACSSLEIKKMLLKIGLLSFKSCDLILHVVIFVFLGKVFILHVFFSLQHIICQLLSNVLSFSCQLVIQSFFLRSQSFYFLVIKMDLLLQSLDCFLKSVDLTFQSRSESTSCHFLLSTFV